MKKKGMTLIEIIIALAILGILAVSFLSLFTTGFTSIIRAGNLSKATYKSQQAIENRIGKDIENAASDLPSGIPNISTDDVSSFNVQMEFEGTIINVPGKIDKVIYNDGKENVKISTFIPEK